MFYEVKNDKVSIKVTSMGAQLCSLKVGDSEELIWKGDAAFWSSHAPILFPIVGALREDKTIINGKEYSMPKHGLVRKSDWELASQGEDYVELQIKATEDTLKAYPFNYTLKAKYQLIDDGVKSTFTVVNNDDIDMPYFIGGHPGFSVPFEAGYTLEDYELKFSAVENMVSPEIIMETSIYDFTKSKVPVENTDTLKLNNEIFSNDVIVYKDFAKKEIAINNSKTGKKITMNFEELNMLGIWKPYNEAPFVCLEPWLGCSTTTTENNEFVEKVDCQTLAPKQEKAHSFTVKFN